MVVAETRPHLIVIGFIPDGDAGERLAAELGSFHRQLVVKVGQGQVGVEIDGVLAQCRCHVLLRQCPQLLADGAVFAVTTMLNHRPV